MNARKVVSCLNGVALASVLWAVQVDARIASPAPLLEEGHPVAWWFAFKFNSSTAPGCAAFSQPNTCKFGGSLQSYDYFSQQYIYASSDAPNLTSGENCVGTTSSDPVGATFGEIYYGKYYYVIWNDQFYDAPKISGCSVYCPAPWGHSKGILAWDDDGSGVVMQVSTPSWPASGSPAHPRQNDGNTLGCVLDNDVAVSQHFFALRLNHEDVIKVLLALSNASVVTDPDNPQIVNNGGPGDIQTLVGSLGRISPSRGTTHDQLSSGVQLISKPSNLHVPPWQMVSSVLGGVPLRVASWWMEPEIPSTDSTTPIACWDDSLSPPSAVEIATTGRWGGKSINLTGGLGPGFNHAKLAVSKDPALSYVIFGDMNQQGALGPENQCDLAQNGRGGLFFVLRNSRLFESVSRLLHGKSAPPILQEK